MQSVLRAGYCRATGMTGINPTKMQTDQQGTTDVADVAITNYRRSVRRSLCYLANSLDALECLECMAKIESP
jgi:hypothetical protein